MWSKRPIEAVKRSLRNRPLLSIVIDGDRYLLGGAGSLVLACPNCGDESRRDADDWKAMRPMESCAKCGPAHLKQPIRIDEMDEKWLPLWKKNGWL